VNRQIVLTHMLRDPGVND